MISKAISRALSVAIVIVIIAVAFGGYSVGSLDHKSRQTTTTTLSSGNGVQTVTEVDLVVRTGYYTQYISSNCTTGGGTISLSNPSTTTAYILASRNASGTLVVTITTIQIQSTTLSTVVIHAKPLPYSIQEMNGTITSYTTETCPTYA